MHAFALLVAASAASSLSSSKIALPAPPPVIMDYLAAGAGQVWVPAGNTGKVFVLDAAAGTFRSVEGFPTKKGSNDRLMGPSSVTLGQGHAFIGNRGDSKICAVDARTLEKKGCVEMPGTPDGTFYVGATREVWVTTPREKSLQIIDVKEPGAPKLVGKMDLEGQPEGYAVDVSKGLVYTNLEDKDRTLVIDAKARKVVSTFQPGCGEAGPRGLAIDPGRGVLLVACTDGVVSLDARSGGRKGRIETGKGVDNIDYVRKRLYATAGLAEKLTVAEVADDGALRPVASAPVGKGCRVVVATDDGTAYAADSAGAQLWVVKPQR
jgi:DNA-binding beta-propeller fold protein YncE